MKVRPLCALVLFAATLAPAITNAQAPAGVARVDSDTYFDTSESSWGYRNHQNDFAGYPGGPANQSAPLPWWLSRAPVADVSFDSEPWRSGHAGLLGKAYIRGSYLYHSVDDQSIVRDNSFVGWDAEINLPVPPLTTDVSRVDFFVDHNYGELSGQVPTSSSNLSFEHNLTIVGARVSALPDCWFRPFVGIGAGFAAFDLEVTGGTNVSAESDESELIIDLGFEADIASNAAFRADFGVLRGGDVDDLADGEIYETTFEGSLILWPHRNLFFRTGLIVSLEDELFDVGTTLGGGLAY